MGATFSPGVAYVETGLKQRKARRCLNKRLSGVVTVIGEWRIDGL